MTIQDVMRMKAAYAAAQGGAPPEDKDGKDKDGKDKDIGGGTYL